MSKNIKIKQGLNIKMPGEAEKILSELHLPETCAVKPTNFNNLIPKLLVKQGEEVLAGTPLFYDKNNEAIKFCAPVSGEVVEIVRGEKRRILEIRILTDKEIRYVEFTKANPPDLDKEKITDILLKSGTWPFLRQRPFGIIANPYDKPKAIFISGFDSNPLAPDYSFIMQHAAEDFQAGLNVLQKLTYGKVHLTLHIDQTPVKILTDAAGVQVNWISGPHPSGNVGVQIHHIDPVNKGEVVWCINTQDVEIIGRIFTQGKYDASKIIAVTGSQVTHPQYFKTIAGSAVKNMLFASGLKDGENRIISGNVLTGRQISPEGYLDFYDSQLTVISEGNEPEFMGWLSPGLNKFSMSHSFFSWLTPNKKYNLNTNMHGEERPFVMTGQYEKVFPMDIYPVQLLKAALIEDIELMENLGIYEVVEEDFALCEFVCTSKIECQEIIRKGLDLVRKEMG
ncbi:MAG TPA: Na(+)-translocating NADH-quinone reductase subunit A [Flavisolibacter sp.]|nr:Na(+)-translocating NADH-quinone reductase subunit A [Flavisolibacter sp.]